MNKNTILLYESFSYMNIERAVSNSDTVTESFTFDCKIVNVGEVCNELFIYLYGFDIESIIFDKLEITPLFEKEQAKSYNLKEITFESGIKGYACGINNILMPQSIRFIDLVKQNIKIDDINSYNKNSYFPIQIKFFGKIVKKVYTGKILAFIHPMENYNEGLIHFKAYDFEKSDDFIPPDRLLKYDKSLFAVVNTQLPLNEDLKQLYEILNDFIGYIKKVSAEKIILAIYYPAFKMKRLNFTEKNLGKLNKMLKEKQAESVIVGSVDKDGYATNLFSLEITFPNSDLFSQSYQNQCGGIAISFSDRFIEKNGINREKLKDILLSKMKQYFIDLKAVYAFLGYSSYSSFYAMELTPFEAARCDSIWNASTKFNENIRGYYWTQILSKGHLDKISLTENINENEIFIDKIDDDSVCIQLNKNIFEVKLEDYREIRKLLMPLFPPKNRDGKIYSREHISDEEEHGRDLMLFDEDMFFED